MFRTAIPVLHVASSKEAERFYRDQLGFELRFAYRVDESRDDPCYMGFHRDGAYLHISSFPDDSQAGAAVYLIVDDVDDVYRELVEKGIEAALEPTDQTWGNREMYLEDADGNSIRFIQEG